MLQMPATGLLSRQKLRTNRLIVKYVYKLDLLTHLSYKGEILSCYVSNKVFFILLIRT
jgi:hypothetical protein